MMPSRGLRAAWPDAFDAGPLLKIADLAEFARGRFPLQRMLLDLRSQPAGRSAALTALPWAGFLVDAPGESGDAAREIVLSAGEDAIRAGDVVELLPDSRRVAPRYRRGSNGNVLFSTERCNSACLMCSQPPRDVEDDWRLSRMRELVDLIDTDERALAISGGEPTLLGPGLQAIVAHCADALPATRLHILSNGRRLQDIDYCAGFRALHPALSWGIPLYADHAALHDEVVQSRGAFAETLRGLYALHGAGQRIEVRVVLVAPTVARLPELVRFLHRNLPFVEHVALMGIEPIGFARANAGRIGCDPAAHRDTIAEAALHLHRRGMRVSLYNLPLCTLREDARPFARRSISDWKQTYLDACAPCLARDQCPGFFAWTGPGWTSRGLRPFLPTSPQESQPCER